MTNKSPSTEQAVDAIRAALERDVRINLHRYPIEARKEHGRLVLAGTAENIVAKRLAVNYALQYTENNIGVDDQLRIATSDVGDLELRDALARQLGGERIFAQTTILVDAKGDGLMVHDAGPGADRLEALIDKGRATLTGSVSSLAHRRVAELLAWWTQGVAAVVNRLEVLPPEEDNDNEIAEAVHMAFEKDPLVHAEQIRPRSADGVVMLTGSVASDEERQLAVTDTWYVPGVMEVVDRIELHGDAPTHRHAASTRPYH